MGFGATTVGESKYNRPSYNPEAKKLRLQLPAACVIAFQYRRQSWLPDTHAEYATRKDTHYLDLACSQEKTTGNCPCL